MIWSERHFLYKVIFFSEASKSSRFVRAGLTVEENRSRSATLRQINFASSRRSSGIVRGSHEGLPATAPTSAPPSRITAAISMSSCSVRIKSLSRRRLLHLLTKGFSKTALHKECHSATTMRSRRAADTVSGFDLPRNPRILSKMICRVHAENCLLLSVNIGTEKG